MQRMIYGEGKPYITQDERKLNEVDIREIEKPLHARDLDKHFNLLVTRIVPDRFEFLAKIDRLLLVILKPFARFLSGRIFFSPHSEVTRRALCPCNLTIRVRFFIMKNLHNHRTAASDGA